MIEVLVLGAGAGGGFPQWNSNAPACRRSRARDPLAPSATQASIAVSGDGRHWFLLNAAPELRIQIERNPALQPTGGLRSSPICGVILTGAEVDNRDRAAEPARAAGVQHPGDGTGAGTARR